MPDPVAAAVPGARLAVLGSPIAHSLSPALHSAAYRTLGLDWEYGSLEMTGDRLAGFLRGLEAGWRGLSLTMPLKRDVLPLLDRIDEVADATGSANTVLIADAELRGFNTDVEGITGALGTLRPSRVQVLGAGATAASAVAAAARLGADRVEVSARSLDRAAGVVAVGQRVGVAVEVRPWGSPAASVPDLIVNTLPGHAALDAPTAFPDETVRHAVLFEVAYDPWPGPLAARWLAAGGTVVPGIEMLVRQAVAQVRIFVGGDPDAPLDSEQLVVEAMRAAVGLPWPPESAPN